MTSSRNEPTSPIGGEDLAALLATLVEAVEVRRRFEFFAWSQSRVRDLLPHGVLVCGLPRHQTGRMFFDYFYSVPIEPPALARLCNPRHGIAAEMMESWIRTGCDPLVIGENGAGADAQLAAELASLGFGRSLVHGIPASQSQNGAFCFFAFVSMPAPPGERESLLAQILVPYLFNAYVRALASDRPAVAVVETPEIETVVTDREIEILRWIRDGKSNQEIGMILNISPLTVKNHVQKILRKLGASNRAQAASMAIAMKLLANAGTRLLAGGRDDVHIN